MYALNLNSKCFTVFLFLQTIFGGIVLEKKFTLSPNESFPYNIQRNGWKIRSSSSVFDPHEGTLRDIDNIYEKFNLPENPLSNAEPPKRRREHIDNMELLSPPRRVRRCGIKQLTDSSQHSSCPIHEIPYEVTVCIHLSMIRKKLLLFIENSCL